ncbi:MAG: sporulation protein YabP [Clostridiales bacterium]|nr:sporulation protein YabP [Clostridiales bacterium]
MIRDLDEKKTVRGRNHSILMENRQKVSITGVQDVDSFDESTIILVTELGYITLHGIDLHISKLNLEEGQLIAEGEMVALQYSDTDYAKGKGSGLLGRLFR